MVIMSMAAYEEQLARIDMYTKIMEGKSQADEGKLIDGDLFFKEMREKYAK